MLKQTTININNAIVQKLSELTDRYNAINLSHNHSEFACPTSLIESLNRHIATNSKYAPIDGCIELRKAISNMLNRRFFRSFDPETEITITEGATQAIFCAIASSVGEGDEVIVFEPLYKTYTDAITLSGARATFLQIKPDLTIDWNEVQKAITANTKLIIVNSPHFPTGAIFTLNDWELLQKLIIGTKIKVLSDESLSEVSFSDSTTTSISFFPRLANSSFMISSLSKSLCVCGWKIGYCVAPAEITTNFRKIQGIIANSINNPMQIALADYINGLKTDLMFPYMDIIEQNRTLARTELADTKFKLLPSNGGYYMVIDYSDYSNIVDIELSKLLIKEYGVSVMPMSLFYHDKHDHHQVRINIAVETKKLSKAIEQLKKFANDNN